MTFLPSAITFRQNIKPLSLRVLKQHKHKPLRVDISCSIDNKELTLRNKFSVVSVTFYGTYWWSFDSFGQKFGTEHWAVCDASNSNTKFTKDANNETVALTSKPREELYIEVVKNIFAISYYCLYGILFLSHLIIPLRTEFLPITEISVIFHCISLGIETPNKGPPKLTMKMYLITTW